MIATARLSCIRLRCVISCTAEGYSIQKADLERLIEIMESTDQTKGQIEAKLEDHRLYQFNFGKDTVALERVTLIFKNYRLEKIEKQW